MIVAMALAVVALSFGFGVFAAFRVSHEPLTRLPATATPFQYVADNAAPPAGTFTAGQSFGSRFQLSEAMIAGAAAGISRAPDSTDGGPPSAATVAPAADSGEPAQPPAAAAAAAAAPESETAAIEASDDQASPAAPATELPKPETAGPAAAAPAEPPKQSNAGKAASRHRQAAKLHRARRARATAIAQSANQNAAFPAPNFKTAPPAVGGPFVSPPAR